MGSFITATDISPCAEDNTTSRIYCFTLALSAGGNKASGRVYEEIEQPGWRTILMEVGSLVLEAYFIHNLLT
jgi:hypothetical protein